MEISEKQLQSFIDLYQKKFGVVLAESEAHKKASTVLQYVMLCIKPLAKPDETDINNTPD